jgi:hypothetical protein
VRSWIICRSSADEVREVEYRVTGNGVSKVDDVDDVIVVVNKYLHVSEVAMDEHAGARIQSRGEV